LAPWVLQYTTNNTNVPFTKDIAQVVNVTDMFLSDYFFDLFGRVNFATLDDFMVMFVNSEYSRDGPNEIQYSAVAFFDKESATIPQANDLDVLLRQAFVGASLANYTQLVRALPTDNPFSTTSKVTYSNSTTATKSSVQGTQLSGGKKAAIAGASVVIAAVGVLIGVFIFRKRRSKSEERKSLVHDHFSFGDTIVTTSDDRTLESQSIAPNANLHNLRGAQTQSAYMNDEFESLAGSSTYTSGTTSRTVPHRTSNFESMLYDNELPEDDDDDFPVNAELQPPAAMNLPRESPLSSGES